MGDDRLVELAGAHSAFEAELIVGALKGVEITAVSTGSSLTDEFAMSQQLIGMGGGVRVMVAEADLARAQQALAQFQASRAERAARVDIETGGPHAERPDPAPQKPRGNPWKTIAIVLGLVGMGLAALAFHLNRQVPPSDPLLEAVPTAKGVNYRWRESGNTHSRWLDQNHNGIYEEVQYCDTSGRLVMRAIDNDENGVFELAIHLDSKGQESARGMDPDQDGRWNHYDEKHGNGPVVRAIDADGDGRWEASEGRDPVSGAVLWRATVDPESGWTTTTNK